MVGTILLFVVILSVLVFVHEFGHFVMAKKMGMHVEEFGFGFPPRLWGIKKGPTVYSINWIPLGGFVKIKGESGDLRDHADSFASKPAWQRLTVLVAGVAMNMLLAASLLSIGFMIGLPSVVDETTSQQAQLSNEQVQLVSVLPDSPAANAGVKEGDVLLSIDGNVYTSASDARSYIQASGDNGVTLSVKRDKEYLTFPLKPEMLASVGVVGVGIGLVKTALVSYPWYLAIVQGIVATGEFTWAIVRSLVGLIGNLVVHQTVSVDLSGPVGIAVMTGEAAALGFVYLLQFTAILSINLAVVNILPFPALDGGRALFVIIEKIRHRAVSGRLEAFVHNLGFALLMGLVILVTYRDFVKFGGQLFATMTGK